MRIFSRLTRRQQEVLDLAFRHFSTKEIAQILRLSQRTVEEHKKATSLQLGITYHELLKLVVKEHLDGDT